MIAGRTFEWKAFTITLGTPEGARIAMSNIEIGNGLCITEIRIWPVHNPEATRVKANVSIEFNGAIRVNCCRLIEGAKGLFLSFPCEKRKGSENWDSYFHPVTRDASAAVEGAVTKLWHEMLAAAGPTR